jgi:cation diffusion facilitator CzcD-associated flavoprotein CzcO
MLQRSPSYVFNRPKRDWFANLMKRILPPKLAYDVARFKFTFMSRIVNNHILKHPAKARERLMGLMKRDLPEGFDMRHFTPSYDVWDQRVCAAPDGDFFEAVKGGNVEVATGQIKQISKSQIEIEGGSKIDADIIIKATGLNLIAGPKFALSVDGNAVDISKCVIYKGAMYSNVPNFAFVFGYLMASWTLKADLVAQFFIRFIDETEAKGAKSGTPKLDVNSVTPTPMFNFSSGYITRSIDKLPKQTANFPWQINQDYKVDKNIFLKMPIGDGVIEFGGK